MTLSSFQPPTGPAQATEKTLDRKYQRIGLIIEMAKLLRQGNPDNKTEDLLREASCLVDEALAGKTGPLKRD